MERFVVGGGNQLSTSRCFHNLEGCSNGNKAPLGTKAQSRVRYYKRQPRVRQQTLLQELVIDFSLNIYLMQASALSIGQSNLIRSTWPGYQFVSYNSSCGVVCQLSFCSTVLSTKATR